MAYDFIPQRIKDALDRYAKDRQLPGGFCQAVLCNDLTGAIFKADAECLPVLHYIVDYVYNELPGPCWGSADAVKAWVAASK